MNRKEIKKKLEMLEKIKTAAVIECGETFKEFEPIDSWIAALQWVLKESDIFKIKKEQA